MSSPEYVVARRALLDALEALGDHGDALILVGAQAVYLHTGGASFAVAEHTTDGDVAVDPRVLGPSPEIAGAMRAARFFLDERDGHELVGVWASWREIDGVAAKVTVDLLVPAALGGGGRRAARVEPHERGSMLKVHGLEAAAVDNGLMQIGALDESDEREFTIRVAGPAALLVAKVIKLSDRVSAGAGERGSRDRARPKDALDILRVLQAIATERLVADLERLEDDELAGPVTREALTALSMLFSSATAPGSLLAAEAAAPESSAIIAASCVALGRALTEGLALRHE